MEIQCSLRTIIFVMVLIVIAITSNPAVFMAYAGVPSEPHPANAMWIEPSAIDLAKETHDLGYKFNVTVWVNITSVPSPTQVVKTWQFVMSYDKSKLNATRCCYTEGVKSQFFSNITAVPIEPQFGILNITHNFVMHGETWISGPKRTVPGYGSLSWVEFEVMAKPPEGQTYTSLISLVTTGVRKCKILDDELSRVSFATYHSVYRYGAYKLEIHIKGGKNATIEGNAIITDVVVTRSALHFAVSGPSGSTGWINITFPMVNTTAIEVLIDQQTLAPPPFPVITANETHYFTYFEFTLSTREITFSFGPLAWETSFIGLGGYPIVDFAVYKGKLYAASDNSFYVYDESSWDVIDAPAFMLSLKSYQDKLIIGGKNGLYSYNGTAFTLIFPVSTYIKPLGVYNNTLYAGTVLAKPPTLYYCNGSAENSDNWHIDTAFSTILNFSGPFGSIDSFAVYNNKMYVSSGGTVYSYNGTHWSIAKTYGNVNAFLGMKVYNGKLYLATRDQGWRKPLYQGGTGFSGRVIEFNGSNWTTVFDYDYWIYSLETYDGKLYAGTANKIFTYNGTDWETSYSSEEGAYYAISMITYDGKIYAGMGNGYIFEDPSLEALTTETIAVPEFALFFALPLFMTITLLVAIVYRKKKWT